jgi:hypothetical protein
MRKKYKIDFYQMLEFDSLAADLILSEILEKKKLNKNYKTIVILDDVLEDKKLLNSKFLSLLFTRSRHYNISVIFSSQNYKSIPKKNRINCTNMILFKFSNSKEKDAVYEEVINVDKHVFNEILKNTFDEKYNFLNIDLKSSLNKRYSKNFDSYFQINDL